MCSIIIWTGPNLTFGEDRRSLNMINDYQVKLKAPNLGFRMAPARGDA
jgi:hypothetical protein